MLGRELNSIWPKTNIVKSLHGSQVTRLLQLMYEFQETPWQVILLIPHHFPGEFLIKEYSRNFREHTSKEHIYIYSKHNVKTTSTYCGPIIGLAHLRVFQIVFHGWKIKEIILLLELTVGKRSGIQGYTASFSLMYVDLPRLQKGQP